MDYKRAYFKLFNEITDIIKYHERQIKRLIAIQQQMEDDYTKEPDTPLELHNDE